VLAILGAVAISYFGQGGGEADRYRELLKLSGTKNGYGDFVQAAIIAARPENKVLLAYLRAVQTDPLTKRPEEIPPDLSPLAGRRFAVDQMGGAIDLVRRGIAKPCFYPDRGFWMATLQPEFFRFRSIAYLLVNAADVSLSEGKPQDASKLLLDGVQFTGKLEEGTSIAVGVSRTSRSIILKYVADHLGLFSASDWARLSQWSAEQDRKPTTSLASVVAERESLRRSWFEFCRNPDLELKHFVADKKIPEVASALRKLTPKRKAEIYDQFLARLESSLRAVEKRLRQPEARWRDKLDIPVYAPAIVKTSSDPTEASFGVFAYLKLYQALSPDSEDQGMAENLIDGAAKERVRNRILGLYAAVSQYRLRKGHLPKTLAEAVGHVPKDRLLGKPFNYLPNKDQVSFRIFASFPDGQMDLTFHRNSGPKT
jgi:hypothetical protein